MPLKEGYDKARLILKRKYEEKHIFAMDHLDQIMKAAPIKSDDGALARTIFNKINKYNLFKHLKSYGGMIAKIRKS